MKIEISWIEKFKKIHGDKYDYSLFEYNGYRNRIKIICPIHGIYEQFIQKHLNHGCKKCSVKRMSKDEFISKSIIKHGNKYDYSLVEFEKTSIKVKIICKEHGTFEQTPNSHLDGHGCKECGGTSKLHNNKFIQRSKVIHGLKYDYSKVNYKSMDDEVIISCKEHGLFKQTPRIHLNGSGCRICFQNSSKLENDWLDSINVEKKNRQVKLFGYTVDGYCPNSKTIFEFYGDFWHGNPMIYKSSDINKKVNKSFGFLHQRTLEREEFFRKNGYNVVSIWESQYKNI